MLVIRIRVLLRFIVGRVVVERTQFQMQYLMIDPQPEPGHVHVHAGGNVAATNAPRDDASLLELFRLSFDGTYHGTTAVALKTRKQLDFGLSNRAYGHTGNWQPELFLKTMSDRHATQHDIKPEVCNTFQKQFIVGYNFPASSPVHHSAIHI